VVVGPVRVRGAVTGPVGFPVGQVGLRWSCECEHRGDEEGDEDEDGETHCAVGEYCTCQSVVAV